MTNNYDRYNHMRSNGPIIVQSGYQGAAVYVVGHQEAKQILGDHKRFVKDVRNTLPPEEHSPSESRTDVFSLLYNNMLETDQPNHTRLRTLVSKAFTSRRIQSLAPRIQENVYQARYAHLCYTCCCKSRSGYVSKSRGTGDYPRIK